MKATFFEKSSCAVLSALLVMSLCVFETGCTKAQFDGVVATVNTQLPAVESLAVDIAALTGDQQVASVTASVAGAISADLPGVQAAVSAYLANKTSGTKNAIFATVSALATSINAQVLQANKVLNPQSQQSVLRQIAAVAAVVNGMQLALAPFFNKTVQAKADFLQVQPYIPRSDVDQVAKVYGYSAADIGL